MLNKLFLASLIALSSSTATVAHADRRLDFMQPTDETVCERGQLGHAPLFQIDRRLTAQIFMKDYVSTSIIVSTNGAWRYTATQNGHVVEQKYGCLSQADVAKLATAVATAKWQVTHAEVKRMAEGIDTTSYSVRGKVVFSSTICDGQILDAASRKALTDANAIVGKLFPKT